MLATKKRINLILFKKIIIFNPNFKIPHSCLMQLLLFCNCSYSLRYNKNLIPIITKVEINMNKAT